jgi:two-component system phosphate regulon sensor histidine kinase PhoR
MVFKKANLFYKIFGTYVIIILLGMMVVGFLVGRQVKTRLMERIECDLTTYAQMIKQISSEGEITKNIVQLATISDTRVTLIDATGKVLADSDKEVSRMDNHMNRPEVQEARVMGKGKSTRFSHTLNVDMFYVAIPVKDAVGGIKGYVRLARPLIEIRQSMRELYGLILQSFLIILILSFLIAFIFFSRLISPIEEMEQYTEMLRNGDDPGTLMIGSGDEMGRLAGNINYMVTELRDRVRYADEEKGKLEAAFASMTDGVLVLDNQDKIEAFNDSFETMFRINRHDILGQTSLEVFRNIDLQNAIDCFKEDQAPVFREITIEGEPGLVLDINISSIHGLPESETKTMIVFHDLTHLKKLEKMRADFVANVTHEIKTPLTAILGFVETLQEGAIEDKETASKFLQTIRKHAERLNRLVDDLLTISDIELGETSLFFESVSISGIIESVLSIVESKAVKKGLTVEKNAPDNLLPIRADRDKLTQILLNVLDNAVKFTPGPGKIAITAFDDKTDNVTINISDTGIGVPKDEIPRLGERFYRVDKTRSRELGGTGLGMSIVKHLMMAHEGEIKIESRLGKGTTVSLVFPVFHEDLIA